MRNEVNQRFRAEEQRADRVAGELLAPILEQDLLASGDRYDDLLSVVAAQPVDVDGLTEAAERRANPFPAGEVRRGQLWRDMELFGR